MSRLTQLHLYPVKSCAGISLTEATLSATGLMSGGVHDREWMVVDQAGKFLTQREVPRLALIRPRLTAEAVELEAPAMPPLILPIARAAASSAGQSVRVAARVWDDIVPSAEDCGQVAADWLAKVLDMPCRLLRFPTDGRRTTDSKWTGQAEAFAMFADGFPLLLISEASLADLNKRLSAQGRAPLPMNRFRPNLVIDGIEAYEEDYLDVVGLGQALLKPVKPCPRCPIPSVDQATAVIGPDPLDILRTYRANPKLDGAITFGMNVITLSGIGQVLQVGQQADVEIAF